MDFTQPQTWLVPVILAALVLRRFLKARSVARRIPALLKAGAQVVDVRSPAEFQMGAPAGAVNIPLNQLQQGLATLDRSRSVLVCCASGTRSAIAGAVLRKAGFHPVVNAGSWTNIDLAGRTGA